MIQLRSIKSRLSKRHLLHMIEQAGGTLNTSQSKLTESIRVSDVVKHVNPSAVSEGSSVFSLEFKLKEEWRPYSKPLVVYSDSSKLKDCARIGFIGEVKQLSPELLDLWILGMLKDRNLIKGI